MNGEIISMEEHNKILESLKEEYETRMGEAYEETYKYVKEEIDVGKKKANKYSEIVTKINMLRQQKKAADRAYRDEMETLIHQLIEVQQTPHSQWDVSPPLGGPIGLGATCSSYAPKQYISEPAYGSLTKQKAFDWGANQKSSNKWKKKSKHVNMNHPVAKEWVGVQGYKTAEGCPGYDGKGLNQILKEEAAHYGDSKSHDECCMMMEIGTDEAYDGPTCCQKEEDAGDCEGK